MAESESERSTALCAWARERGVDKRGVGEKQRGRKVKKHTDENGNEIEN